MHGILIVAFLVNCSQSLLLCNEIDTRHFAYSDMAACQGALTRIVEDHQRQLGDTRVVMGKCRYQVRAPASDRAVAQLPKGRRIRRLAAVDAPRNPTPLPH